MTPEAVAALNPLRVEGDLPHWRPRKDGATTRRRQ